MKVHPDFAEFIASLNDNHVEFVIVGAYALAFLGVPRYTGDIDVWIRPTMANAKALLRAVERFGFQSLSLTEEDILSGQIIQMGYPPMRIDLLTELDGVTPEEIWSSRQKGPFGDQTVFYIGREILVKNKRAAGRPKDVADLASLGEAPRPRGKRGAP
ncbi:MAG: nucleotidyltransferase [Elusimicrobia bacterium]|nr:nucleotidyltransferase [Elusimicrobiota bacterium]